MLCITRRGSLSYFLSILFVLSSAFAFDSFTIEDIRVTGLQRISEGAVFNELPFNTGELMDERRSAEAIRALFRTGFFQDIDLQRDGNVLVIAVTERPAISEITFAGNKDITSDQLKEALEKIGLAKGRVFNPSSLDKVEGELQRQYFNRGKYGVSIKSEVKPLERNRVDISINIAEGQVAKIRSITIVGNTVFDDDTLLGRLELNTPTMFSFISGNDRYDKPKLTADLETLRSYYLDRGYINFTIDSTQVSITPDKKNVYITINISEGDRFSVKEVKLDGELIVPEEELARLISLAPGDIFSRKLSSESSSKISERLGDEGYAFTNINTIPDINMETKEVSLTFFVDPGRRIYVRRLGIVGNEKTQDEVLRREFRQMEGGWISTEKVNRSRVRLQRLGYFEGINVETPAVPGVNDQVDVNFSVKERPAGTLTAGIGYSDAQGVLLNASVSHNNFFGTGKRVSTTINNSSVNTVYSFGYTNPYYTLDGVSRGFQFSSRQTNAGQADVGDYLSDVMEGSVNYGLPINELQTVRLGIGLETTDLRTTVNTPQSFIDFLNANASSFDTIKGTASWSYDSRNSTLLATSGTLQSVSLDVALPGSGLTYYKLNSRTRWFTPLTRSLTLLLKADIGYGDSYSDTTALPFFENFYAGGSQSVRGYRSNSLGPQENDKRLGGAFRTVGGLELILPAPFASDVESFRLSAFIDGGNVYADVSDYDSGELRFSTGVAAIWLSPIGPLTFSLARALNEKPGDRTQNFQFSLGTFF
ncbi:MAG: outer membrane protein [Gammaproteobacteria bacterium]|nr:MAG: outer membrane protein [Gammaproteobacteria bacterium]TND07096.1 MAG: outer membrane protein [Gammaproteobacteria bacterium]